MSEYVKDETLAQFIEISKDLEWIPYLEPRLVYMIMIELRDARARIKELEAINGAQVESLIQMHAMVHDKLAAG